MPKIAATHLIGAASVSTCRPLAATLARSALRAERCRPRGFAHPRAPHGVGLWLGRFRRRRALLQSDWFVSSGPAFLSFFWSQRGGEGRTRPRPPPAGGGRDGKGSLPLVVLFGRAGEPLPRLLLDPAQPLL